jgi:DNA-binding MarR family transcriptional regulator
MNLTQSLILFQRTLVNAWSQAAANEGISLTANEFDYLWCVHRAESAEFKPSDEGHDDGSHLSALAAEMQVQKSSASAMVSKLEKKGLIHRVNCQFDARAQHILLTESGRALFVATREAVYTALSGRMGRCLSPAELLLFTELLDRINAAAMPLDPTK